MVYLPHVISPNQELLSKPQTTKTDRRDATGLEASAPTKSYEQSSLRSPWREQSAKSSTAKPKNPRKAPWKTE